MAGTLVIYTFVASSFQAAWLFHALTSPPPPAGAVGLHRRAGVRRITDAIAHSNWDPKDTKKGKLGGRFSRQAMLTLAGLVVVTLATITGVGFDSRSHAPTNGSTTSLVRCKILSTRLR